MTRSRTRSAAGDELAVLASFDAAPAESYDDVAATRAEARLEQILATDPLSVRDQAVVPRARRRGARAVRLAAVPALAAAALVLSVVLPGGHGAAPAFAGWTPTPTPVPASALAAIEQACARGISALIADPEVRVTSGIRRSMDTSEPAAVEQRGDFGVAAFTGEGHTVDLPGKATTLVTATALCLTYGPPGAPEVAQIVIRDSAPWMNTVVMSTTPGLPFVSEWSGGGPHLALGPGQVGFTAAMGGQMGTEGAYTIFDGMVGPDVVGVSLRVPGAPQAIEATVSNGFFVAWAPGSLRLPGSRNPLDHLAAAASATLTLADGTVLENVPMTTDLDLLNARIRPDGTGDYPAQSG